MPAERRLREKTQRRERKLVQKKLRARRVPGLSTKNARWISNIFSRAEKSLSKVADALQDLQEPITPGKITRLENSFRTAIGDLNVQRRTLATKKFRTAFGRAAEPAFNKGKHDIVNTMGSIHYLLRDLKDGKTVKALESRNQMLRRLKGDLANTRAYRKIYGGERDRRLCDVSEILQNLHGFGKAHKYRNRNVRLRVHDVKADPDLLYFSLFNLATNAIKSAQEFVPARMVSISSWKTKKGVHISVQDEGVGFNIGDLSSFLKGRSGFKEQGMDGKGSGLVLVKNAVELMGGKLEAHSDGPGKGARFTIILPAA